MTKAFDSEKYFGLQSERIKERIAKFPNGKLYFEIGGKFLYDAHAKRVLPGFDPKVKIKILKSLGVDFSILFCLISRDLENDRVWVEGESYEETILKKLEEIKKSGLPKPQIALNLYEAKERTQKFEEKLNSLGYRTYKRYAIEGYPDSLEKIVSKEGFGKDEYVETNGRLIVVVGAGSRSGKMNTCLGQVYLDHIRGLDSGYAKYETFPVWNKPLDHPANLAYEAATADIGDYNMIDPFHLASYGINAVNYNRDIEAFPIIKKLIEKIASGANFMSTYNSPTDMGISSTGECIIDEEELRVSAKKEIERRRDEYESLAKAGKGEKAWAEKCTELLKKL